MFAGKCVKWEKLLIVFREHIIFNIKWAEVHKKSEVFWVKPFWKMSDLFCYFLLALRLSARKSEIKKKLRWCPLERTLNERYVRNNIFKKRIPDMSFWIIYNLVQISFFGRLVKGISASVFLLFFPISQPWWPTFLLRPTHSTIKKSSYGPAFSWQKLSQTWECAFKE